MKATLVLAILVGVAVADPIPISPFYGWIQRVGFPQAERVRKLEESNDPTRIINGQAATLGQFPYQVGLISEVEGLQGSGLCGGSLVSNNRVVTAAHCWRDGRIQAWRYTVVLGSLTVFSGGTRILTTDVVEYPTWDPAATRNDIAIVRLPTSVATSSTIAPIAIPSGNELWENFNGDNAIASGWGQTADDANISTAQVLSWTNLRVIANNECLQTYPFVIIGSHVCTSAAEGRNICRGDSGGPLAVIRNNAPLLIGITSFYHFNGCESTSPAGYTRVTTFVNFISQNM